MFFSQWDRVISRCVKQRKSILIAWNGRRFWNVCSDPLSIITVIQQMRCIFLKEKYRASHHSFPLEVRTQTTKSNRRNGKLSVVFFFPLFISLHQVLLQLSGSCGCSMQTLECADSVITHRLSCSSTWGFLDPRPEMEPCPLHWKVNCQPLDHQGSPRISVSFEFSEIGPKKISCPG